MSDVERWVQVVDPKRAAERVPIQFDWHDYLANVRQPGASVSLGQRFRFKRRDPRSTGLEYEVTQAGRTGGRVPIFPTTIGGQVTDGSCVLTARALSSASLRGTIGTSTFPATAGLTLSSEMNDDLIYTIWAESGVAGQFYDVVHRVTLNGIAGEIVEAVAHLPVV